MKHFLLIGLLFAASATFAQLPKPAPVPGGVAHVIVAGKKLAKPQVFFDKHPVMVIRDPNTQNWLALVGIPLSQAPGPIQLEIKSGPSAKTKTIEIVHKDYVTEKLTIANQRKVTPLKQDYSRIQHEAKKLTELYSTTTSKDPENLTFSAPIEGRHSSSFGKRRILNGIKKNPHSGMDIAAPTGTLIKLPIAGEVIEAKDYFFAGNTVLVDHGAGLITGYAHLNKINVKVGDQLRKGDIIGEVGKTGRVTGPHLHWSVSLNGMRVDPALFLKSS